MADAHRVDVGNGAQQLVGVQLDEDVGYVLLLLHIVLHYFVQGLGDVLHDHVQVHFVGGVAACVEEVLHLNTERVSQDLQDLQFAVLVPLVLVHLLDGHMFVLDFEVGFVHHPEGPVADYALGNVPLGDDHLLVLLA
eukprot:CAMPEP_0170496284 /NCGR_PEP_ID=MMETSP0208-20121228/20868_1 /TAXON_ID=197538 /ORGANISM="Strombidium inclinatum, Strain S3" /LENGTH=136 /DNA_ID=CAMNT_0010772783 /DNA_START=641 /DNA_END=1048 /DNA_ORIENTATION=+